MLSTLENMPMRWAEVLRFSRLPLSERSFVLFGIVGILVIRLAVILMTPRTADLMDPRIYQGVGQTVLAGVNPYDYADQPARRVALRARMAAGPGVDQFTQTQESWDYYVSGNLPASTALYALFEIIARGSRFEWRLLFILGDVAIFMGLVALLKTLHGGIENASDQAGMLCLGVVNPVSIVAGCAIPEDKQFQTALLLFAAALLLSPAATTARRGLGIGLVLSLSVMFKLLGVFLLPLWLVRSSREWPRFALWTTLGGIIPVAAAFVAFGHYFVHTMVARGVQNSVYAPEQASPWVLLPWFGGSGYVAAKTMVVTLFCGTLAALLAKRRIDLLNFCAGLAVAFVCLWLDKGAMNRMNIAIVFAVAALGSLSRKLFLYFSAAIVLLSAIGYALGVGALRLHPQAVDAVLVLTFVSAYLAALLRFTRAKRAAGPTSIEPIGALPQ
jgi:hypothetical protein